MCRMAYRFRTKADMLGVSSKEIPITKELDHRVDEFQNIPRLVERIDGTTAEGGW
jgi:hypothetical protein